MKWSTHLRITKNVLHQIDTPNSYKNYERILLDACIAPDKVDKNSAHHRGRESTIINHIMSSRASFLQNDLSNTFKELGWALHYIQDRWTLLPSYRPGHDNWEQWIDEATLFDDNYLKQKISEYGYPNYLNFVNTLESAILDKNQTLAISTYQHPEQGKPWIDLNLAYRVSLKVGKAVLQEKTNLSLQNQLEDLFKRSYDDLFKIEEIELNKLNFWNYKLINASEKHEWYKFWKTLHRFYISLKFQTIYKNYNYNIHLEKEVKKYNKKIEEVNEKNIGWYIYTSKNLTYNHILNQREK